ncbi:MAG: hypothetical protein ABIH66_04465 [bacterium]
MTGFTIENAMTEKYIHIKPGEEVESIGGRYVVEKEVRMPVNGREVLVVYGVAVVDKSCCGQGGCRFAQVPGFISEWKAKRTDDGEEITVVEPVEDKSAQKKIQEMIDKAELYCQVNFL